MAIKTIRQKFVLDESGSMLGQQSTIINGFNESLATMRKEETDKGIRYLVSLVKFSDEATEVYKDLPLSQVPELNTENYRPGGWTALYDAIGKAIDTAAPGETDCLVTIFTDGCENRSKQWKSKTAIKTLIDIRQRENKWGFVYFGANQDAWTEAQSIGVFNSLDYTTSNSATAFHAMNMCRSNYVGTAMSGVYNLEDLADGIDKDELVK
jgi:hypothetical protein